MTVRMPTDPACDVLLLTRPRREARATAQALAQAGITSIRMPLQATRRTPSSHRLNADLAFAAAQTLQIFVSRAAVAAAMQIAPASVVSAVSRIAVGRATAAALHQHGLECQTARAEDSDGVLELPILQDVCAQRVVIWAAAGGRERIAQVLTERGAQVRLVLIYQRFPLRPRACALQQLCCSKSQVCLSATSAALLFALDRVLRSAALNSLRTRPIIVVSARIGELARQLGYSNVHVSNGASSAALVESFRSIR